MPAAPVETYFHCTYAKNLSGIAKRGLVPSALPNLRRAAPGNFRGVYLTEQDGLPVWFGKLEDWAWHDSDDPIGDGLVPVVLKVSTSCRLFEDELGSSDARARAAICPRPIPPGAIRVWNGTSWIPVRDHADVDLTLAFDRDEAEDEEDSPGWFKPTNRNPLFPLNDRALSARANPEPARLRAPSAAAIANPRRPPAAVVERYSSGGCVWLALALHDRYGWPIHAQIERAHPPYVAHAFVRRPDGACVDVLGPQREADRFAGEEREFSRAGFIDFVAKSNATTRAAVLAEYAREKPDADAVIERHLRAALADGGLAARRANPGVARPRATPPAALAETYYHCTFSRNLPGIAKRGLVPSELPNMSRRVVGNHRGVYLTERGGMHFWFSKLAQWAWHDSRDPRRDGLVPVVLKVSTSCRLIEDEKGSRDASARAAVCPRPIPPGAIRVWNGTEWIPVREHTSLDLNASFHWRDGEDLGLRMFFRNPLFPMAESGIVMRKNPMRRRSAERACRQSRVRRRTR